MRTQSAGAAPKRFLLHASLAVALASACGSGGTGHSTNGGGSNGAPTSGVAQNNGSSSNGSNASPSASGAASTPPPANSGLPPSSSSGGGLSAGSPSGKGTMMADSGLSMLLEGGPEVIAPVDSDASALDSMVMERPDQGKGDGSDVIMIGDSWMLLSVTGISLSLENPANGGNPAYTNYAVPGTQLLNGQIPSQYTQAKAVKSSIRTVIMTAGGNDVLETGLSADCAAGGATCQMQLQAIGMALGQLWGQMSMDGVTDVVHIEYSRYSGGGLKDPAANEMALQQICDAVPAPMHCHLLNTDTLVGMDLMADGIHPSAAACDRVAQAVTAMMQADGMRR